jgi:aryl-alcohol dehydrogenase-like predicted oxidoreductase
MMTYRTLGRTGVQVSRLCFGTMSFGGDADAATSAAMYKAYRDAGINFYDTADQYNKGKSEEILGSLIKGHRDELVIATKCFNPMGEDVNARGNSRRHVTRAVEASLKRLGTDRVDILFLHQFEKLVPIDEQMRALEDVVRPGKALYRVVSNWSAWQTQKALGIQEKNNWARLQVLQPMYNLVKRQAEVEILPMALANEVGVIPYSPGAAACSRASIQGLRPAGSRRTRCTKCVTARNGCSSPPSASSPSAASAACIR